MQELFNLFYFYDYMIQYAFTEAEKEEYIYLRNYVADIIKEEGA